jgi:hypothetical protein
MHTEAPALGPERSVGRRHDTAPIGSATGHQASCSKTPSDRPGASWTIPECCGTERTPAGAIGVATSDQSVLHGGREVVTEFGLEVEHLTLTKPATNGTPSAHAASASPCSRTTARWIAAQPARATTASRTSSGSTPNSRQHAGDAMTWIARRRDGVHLPAVAAPRFGEARPRSGPAGAARQRSARCSAPRGAACRRRRAPAGASGRTRAGSPRRSG